MEIAAKRPELFDVGVVRFTFHEKESKKYKTVPRESFLEHFRYKYQINIDGTVAAYRFPFLLIGGSLVFKQESGYYEHFYKEVKPWVHYVPVKHDLSDLVQQIEWARANDDQAKRIAITGQQYARDHLMVDKLYCYTLSVLQKYSERQVGEPSVGVHMEHLQQPNGKESKCNCKRNVETQDDIDRFNASKGEL